MGRPRILFITTAYPTRSDPVHCVFVREHARAAALGADVVVLHTVFDAKQRGWHLERCEDSEISDGLETHTLFFGPSPVPKTHVALRAAGVVAAVRQLRRGGFSPHVVHAHFHTSGISGLVAAWTAGAPLVITEHSSAFPRRLLTGRQRFEAKLAFERAALVMPVSRALQEAIGSYGIAANFRIVSNAVDTARFYPGAPAPGRRARLLFVGGLVPIKGIDNLLQAAARLHSRRADWQLEFVGDGPMRQSAEARAVELGVADRVRFTGRLLKAEVAERMRQAHALVLPSLWESQPCVLLEAAATGLPMVATDVGGVSELVSPAEGILCRARDPGALAAALGTMIDTHGDYDRFAMGQRAAALYGREAVGRQLAQIYDWAARQR